MKMMADLISTRSIEEVQIGFELWNLDWIRRRFRKEVFWLGGQKRWARLDSMKG